MVDDEDNEDQTIAKTLWSDTLIDMLVASLKAGKSDEQLKNLLRECKEKGFDVDYLTGKITKEIDATAAMRIRRLM